jgi:hypothetical protein
MADDEDDDEDDDDEDDDDDEEDDDDDDDGDEKVWKSLPMKISCMPFLVTVGFLLIFLFFYTTEEQESCWRGRTAG